MSENIKTRKCSSNKKIFRFTLLYARHYKSIFEDHFFVCKNVFFRIFCPYLGLIWVIKKWRRILYLNPLASKGPGKIRCKIWKVQTFLWPWFRTTDAQWRDRLHYTPKINSHSQIFRQGRSIFCLPHHPKFSDFLDLCLHWESVVRGPDHGKWALYLWHFSAIKGIACVRVWTQIYNEAKEKFAMLQFHEFSHSL